MHTIIFSKHNVFRILSEFFYFFIFHTFNICGVLLQKLTTDLNGTVLIRSPSYVTSLMTILNIYELIMWIYENREFIVVESLLIKTSTPHNSRDLEVSIYYFKLKTTTEEQSSCVYTKITFTFITTLSQVSVFSPPPNHSDCVCCLLSTGVFLLLLQTPPVRIKTRSLHYQVQSLHVESEILRSGK